MRQTAKRNRRNRTTKSKMKTAIKQFMAADTTENKASAIKEAQRMIDRAAKKNVIHKNAAAHRKSQLARVYNSFVTSHT